MDDARRQSHTGIFRALQCATRNGAEDGRVFLREPRRGRDRASGRAGLHAWRHVQPLPGYKTFVNHFHLDFTGRQRASGSLDTPFQDLAAMKSLGLNVIGLSDFHFELHPNDPGPLRLPEQKEYFEASRRASDTDFLVVPWEEPSAYFGGHYNILWPKDVYWTKVRQPGHRSSKKCRATGRCPTPATLKTCRR
jgi:hypothetical protein